VIDLQRDFCSEDGALAALGSDVSPCRTTAEKVAEFLPRIRELVALVAFFRLEYDPTRMSPVQRERLLRDGRPVICAPDSPGSQLFIAPHPDDKVFTKHRYSAFSNGGFVEVLKALSIETLAVTGVDTHICVENTVRDGYDRGYRMLILSDLVATRTSESRRHENALTVMERYFGFVIHSTQFLTLLGANSHEASALPRSR
jgi:ureidoacrylate peracid hydrolase